MMDSGSEPMHQALSDLFRPSKRQRFYRKRTDKGGEDDACVTTDGAAISPEPMTVDDLISRNKDVGQGEGQQEDDGNDDQIPLSFAEVLRQRKASQRRRGGIEFTNLHSSNSAPHQSQPSGAPVLKEEDIPSDIKLVVERFAPQTGQGRVSDTADKHMMAYIDSELAKRHIQGHDTSSHTYKEQKLSPNWALHTGIQRQPAALGKLHEIDLGPDATLRNIALTEAAQRKLDGLGPDVDEKTGKVRLRRDGKPWRARKRRNTDDMKRDKLVEDVMRESRLEIYDEPDEEADNDDQAADDRIADQFRREFMDAISSRKLKTAQEKKTVKGKRAVVDRHKGPKMGGSRSARAAMREMEEAAAKRK